MASIKVERLKDEDISALALTYLQAFDANTAYRYIFPLQTATDISTTTAAATAAAASKTELRSSDQGLLWFFERRLSMLHACGATFLVAKDESGNVIGGVGAVLATRKPSWWDKVVHGMLLWPFMWGFDTLHRAMELDELLEYEEDAKICYVRVVMMAIAPSHQGKGAGKVLFGALLEHLDGAGEDVVGGAGGGGEEGGERHARRVIGLDTQSQGNTIFYSKFGFVVTSDKDVKGFRSWTMVRR